ncbi:MAG: phosphohistidine phosphatase SixA [Anaerolineae bacterium]|nr:phosphohistidine phosphatase SixA [Anaerolineae bacterium]
MTKYLYLVQHGLAKSKDIDPNRSLADQGQRETELMAEMAAKLELTIDEIRHSGKARAEQTAAIFGRALSIQDKVTTVSGLGPMDDVKPVVNAIMEDDRSVMLVGHLPFMGRLVGYLVSSDDNATPVAFRNSGIVCLTPEGQNWNVVWQLIPGG